MKKISVILPTFNAEETIDRCIESIISQTYSNWELLCCDDASTDGTLEKLYNWSKKDSRITVIKNDKNMRAAATRNRCISLAKGEYIALIDDDDYMAKKRLEIQSTFLAENNHIDFVGSSAYLFDEEGIYGSLQPKKSPEKVDFLFSSCFINPSVMFKKGPLIDVGGYRVAKETRRSQDYDLFMRLYSKGYSGFNMDEKLTYYYRGQKSYPKCKYEYRIDEAKVRWINYKQLGLLPIGIIFVIKPLIVGIIPIQLLETLKRRRREGNV